MNISNVSPMVPSSETRLYTVVVIYTQTINNILAAATLRGDMYYIFEVA